VCFALICVGLVLPLPLGTGPARAETPVDVRITDIRDTSFVISWTTVTRETGSIRYGPSASASCEGVALIGTANDRRGAYYLSTVHLVSVSGLDPGETGIYCVLPVSGGADGIPVAVTLGPTLGVTASNIVYGQVETG
jgi:hypothetical protein